MMIVLSIVGGYLLIVGLVMFGVWNQERCIRRNYKKEQAGYMKEHPDSYGIGELNI